MRLLRRGDGSPGLRPLYHCGDLDLFFLDEKDICLWPSPSVHNGVSVLSFAI